MKQQQNLDRDRLQNYRKWVRIYGVRREKFLEFEFTVGCSELTIELVMPYSAFKEFCEENHVNEIKCDKNIRASYIKLSHENNPEIKPFKTEKIINLGEFK